MSTERGGPVPIEASDFFSTIQKRVDMEERRPRVTKASDILGPVLGPSAIVLESLNDDSSAFNGMWIVGPGAVGSPNDTLWWAGMTIANSVNGGHQYASTFRPADAPLIQMVRGWSIIPGTGTRVYTDWAQISGGSATPQWEDITSYMIWGAERTSMLRDGTRRIIAGYVSGSLSDGTTTVSSPLDSADRSQYPMWSNCYISGGNIGVFFLRSNGELAINNMSGATRTGNHQFSLVWDVTPDV